MFAIFLSKITGSFCQVFLGDTFHSTFLKHKFIKNKKEENDKDIKLDRNQEKQENEENENNSLFSNLFSRGLDVKFKGNIFNDDFSMKIFFKNKNKNNKSESDINEKNNPKDDDNNSDFGGNDDGGSD